MPVTTLYTLRHANRLPFTVDPQTGTYSGAQHSPTKLPADPPLTAAGVKQAEELGVHLSQLLDDELREGRLVVYSSGFYRCLQTLAPWATNSSSSSAGGATESKASIPVRVEPGLGEWFGYSSRFTHPRPLDSRRLRRDFFPFIDGAYVSPPELWPDEHGESIADLHDRVATTLDAIVRAVDAELADDGRDRDVSLLCCFHAAPIIAAGRVLTGRMPSGGWEEDDFGCFTAGLSKFVRRRQRSSPLSSSSGSGGVVVAPTHPSDWRNGGVGGGWTCVQNSDTSFLSTGPERGWRFQGDESFDAKVRRGAVKGDIYGFDEKDDMPKL